MKGRKSFFKQYHIQPFVTGMSKCDIYEEGHICFEVLRISFNVINQVTVNNAHYKLAKNRAFPDLC